MKPIIENHGRVFGSDNWYMFYCGKCKKTINMNYQPRLDNCKYCNEPIQWDDNVTSDNKDCAKFFKGEYNEKN